MQVMLFNEFGNGTVCTHFVVLKSGAKIQTCSKFISSSSKFKNSNSLYLKTMMPPCPRKMRLLLLIFLFMSTGFATFSQRIYNARKYWEESTKEDFRVIKQKQTSGDSLSAD